jgi:hypothetical protein
MRLWHLSEALRVTQRKIPLPFLTGVTIALAFACQSVLGIKDEVLIEPRDSGALEVDVKKPADPFCQRPENIGSVSNPVQFCEDFERGFSDFSAFENVGDALGAFFKRAFSTRTDRQLVEAEFDIYLERFDVTGVFTFLTIRGDGKLGAINAPVDVALSQADTLGTLLAHAVPPAPAGSLSLGKGSLLRLNEWARFRLTVDVNAGTVRTAVLFNDGFVLPQLANPTSAETQKPTESDASSVVLPPPSDAGVARDASVDAGPPPVLTVTNLQALFGARSGAVTDIAVRLDNIILRALQ